jgi:hypothetical protein
MNIVEAIVQKNKKYIILISGYLWFNDFKKIVEALSTNLQFEIIYVNQLTPDNIFITSAEQINFPVVNELIKEKLDRDKENKDYHGYIIVSYTFPLEKLDFYPDIHISIQLNSVLQTSQIIDLIKNNNNIKRLNIDEHLAYLSKSWKTNKINKTIILQHDYIDNINKYYSSIFDAIVENINKKLYGENAEIIESNETKKVDKYPLPPKGDKFINTSDNTKISTHDKALIISGEKLADFNKDIDDIVVPDKDIVSNDDDNDDTKDTVELKSSKRSMPYYIGNRKIKR